MNDDLGNLYDLADQEQERANQDASRELVDIISEASRHLSEDQVAVLCWGCGIDKRLVKQPHRRAA